jgi:hypothetical protein
MQPVQFKLVNQLSGTIYIYTGCTRISTAFFLLVLIPSTSYSVSNLYAFPLDAHFQYKPHTCQHVTALDFRRCIQKLNIDSQPCNHRRIRENKV